jgi:hypothetical protein
MNISNIMNFHICINTHFIRNINDAKQIEIAELATPKVELAKSSTKLKWEVIVRTPEHESVETPESINIEDEDDDYIYM